MKTKLKKWCIGEGRVSITNKRKLVISLTPIGEVRLAVLDDIIDMSGKNVEIIIREIK